MAEDLWFLQDWEVYACNRDNHSTTIIWFWRIYLTDESKICSWEGCRSLEGCSEFPPLRQQSLGKKINKLNQHCELEQRKTGAHPSICTLPRYWSLTYERCQLCRASVQGRGFCLLLIANRWKNKTKQEIACQNFLGDVRLFSSELSAAAQCLGAKSH